MYYVYLITNKVNERQYVGVTTQGYKIRFLQHFMHARSGSMNPLHIDMRNQPRDDFEIELLEHGEDDSIRYDREIYYTEKYHTFVEDGGYNLTKGGPGIHGMKSPESRNQKIREAMLHRDYKQEWRDHLSKACKGKRTGKDNSFYGKHHSKESIEKMRKSTSKRPVFQIDVNTNKILNEFMSVNEAVRWLMSEGIVTNFGSTECRIRYVCSAYKYKSVAYGFHWRYKEGSSTNCKVGDELLPEAQDSDQECNSEMI